MKRFTQLYLVAFFSLISVALSAQYSAIRGTVIDDATGETLIGVAVIIDGTTIGSSTDLDGKFEIKVAPGTYNVKASFISFSPTNVKDVVVTEGKVTALGTIRLGANVEQLKEVVVTAKAVRNTEASLVTMKRKSANVIDGISAASFKKIGDSDAASAMSRVTGVSVQGGKYVYVRGLGDRYTKTTLNGMQIPGLDPDRNTVQMDIFPTNVIDNIVVSKSFTADLPADFTGGAVDIETKDFPERKVLDVNVGLGYNPNMHFNSDYITHNGSSSEAFGFNSGSRDIPTDNRTDIPQYTDALGDANGPVGQEYERILRGFDSQMGGYKATSFMNSSLGVSFANQKSISDQRTLGYSFALSYKNDYQFFEDAENNLYGKPQNPDETELIALETRKGNYGVNNVLVGALGSVALKSSLSKIRLNVMHLQNGEKQTGEFDIRTNDVGNEFHAKQFNLEYSERGLTNVLLHGTHNVADKDLELEWKLSPTRSYIKDPDIRFLRLGDGNEGDVIGTSVGLPQRIWRDLEEYNYAANGDATKKLKMFERDAKLKGGISAVYKTRDFNIQNFQILPGNTEVSSDYNPNDLFNEENLYDSDNTGGVRYEPGFIPNNPNAFTSYNTYGAVYGSAEFNPTPLLKSIVGVRVEKFDQYYTGTNQSGSILFNKQKVLEDFDFFPTVNLIYALSEKQNLRFSYSKTIARPSFKEVSYAEILDPITGRTFAGGLFKETANINGENLTLWDGNLESTSINNFDVRWEMYQDLGQTISLSGFYKTFKNPIEVVQFLSDPGTFQARNVGDATVLGLEFEIRQSLNALSEKLNKFMLTANVTVTESNIKMSAAERNSRQLSARTGETIGDSRAMAGQAPYLVNVGLSYNDKEKGNQATLSYNVQGRTLQYVGFANQADVYSVPFNSLNFKASKAFGKDQRMSASFKVSNILDDAKEQVFSSYNSQDQYFSRLFPRRTFSLGFSYKFY